MGEVGGYRLIERLGGGVSGTVWRAAPVHSAASSLATPVAVKVLSVASPASIGQLRREAAVLAELDHPHIVRLLEVIDCDGVPALVMALAQGGSLARLLVERERLAPGEVVAILAPVADALASAHRRGVVHGDVKPSNVLLTSDGEPLVADFGAAGRWGRAGRGSRGADGEDPEPISGTEPYLAPDLLAGGASGPGRDLHALAVTGHQLLTGRLPDPGAASLLREEGSVPPALAAVLEGALTGPASLAPADQPVDLGRFAADLRAAVPTDSIALPGPSLVALAGSPVDQDDAHHRTRLFGPRPPERPAPARRRRWPVPVAVLFLLALSATAVALWARRVPTREPVAARSGDRRVPVPPSCPTFPVLGSGAGAAQLRADLNGDGCPVPVAWDGQVMQVRLRASDPRPARFRFDRRGQLLLGDWNCDGKATPALYLATTGEVVYYNRLADHVVQGHGVDAQGVAGTARAVRPGGSARTVHKADGCDDVQISPAPS